MHISATLTKYVIFIRVTSIAAYRLMKRNIDGARSVGTPDNVSAAMTTCNNLACQAIRLV